MVPRRCFYGANAIGGLVNVITNQIPSAPVQGSTGSFTIDAGTNGGQAGGAGEITAGNGTLGHQCRRQRPAQRRFQHPGRGDSRTRSRAARGFNVGVSSTREKGYVGASYVFDDTKYGIPFVERGEINLTPKRHAFMIRAGGEGLDGAISSYRATLGVKRYTHDELDGEEVATHFDNDTEDGELLVSHRPAGRLSGTIGGSFLNRRFSTEGEEVLAPPVDQQGGAFFLYEELTWPHATVQFGGRFDHTGFSPDGGLPERSFNEFSGSVGLLFRPAAVERRRRHRVERGAGGAESGARRALLLR